jgi:hypothetical protein
VTSVRERNRDRKRRQRQRERAAPAPIVYSTEDWQLFLNPDTLPQKAACFASELPALVLKELADNALDEGSDVKITLRNGKWLVSDNGPGLDPERVAELFAVNRPLRSSKLKRLPTRGMLGNGLRVVMAWARDVTVETRGARLTLRVDEATGHTRVLQRESVSLLPGLTVVLPASRKDDVKLANRAIALAKHGSVYKGPSLPHWYGAEDFARLLRATPAEATVGAVLADLGLKAPAEFASLSAHAVATDPTPLLRQARRQAGRIEPEQIGRLGPDAHADCPGYASKAGIQLQRTGGRVPFVVEAHVECERSEAAEKTVECSLTINRTPSLARVHARWRKNEILFVGCGLGVYVPAPGGTYRVHISVITPHILLTTDGKAPDLEPYEDRIAAAILAACRQAHRASRPNRRISTKDAAWLVMERAYMEASSGGTLPANARQIMYAARGEILQITGEEKLNDDYFTQRILPDYLDAYPEETASWDVVFDDRGALTEPHTRRVVPLGTVAVREYLGERPAPETPATIDPGSMFATTGPLNRYRNILFIEKEGFAALLDRAQIAERFDVGVMSTKGMSVTAARMLIDKLMQSGVERVLVAHDFDVSGFSIFGTLGRSTRRYRFESAVPVVDIGLRLADIEEMGLEPEPYDPQGWERRAITLARHGATPAEIAYLRRQRVELNAMPAGVFVEYLERKLTEHGAEKVVPAAAVLAQHARSVVNRTLLNRRLDAIRDEAEAEAERLALPADLRRRVEAALRRYPALSWDLAVAEIARKLADDDA